MLSSCLGYVSRTPGRTVDPALRASRVANTDGHAHAAPQCRCTRRDRSGGAYRSGNLLPSLWRLPRQPSIAQHRGHLPAALLTRWRGRAAQLRAAAHLLGLLKGEAPPAEVITRTQRRIEGVTSHRSRILNARDATTFRGIPVTTVPRTLVDLAKYLSLDALARACHEAGVRYGTTPTAVEAVLARRPNSPGAKKLRRVVHGDVHVTLSKLEAHFLDLLRDAGLPLPVTNRPAGSRRVDCRWPEHGLTVELDGYRFHNSRHSGNRTGVASGRRGRGATSFTAIAMATSSSTRGPRSRNSTCPSLLAQRPLLLRLDREAEQRAAERVAERAADEDRVGNPAERAVLRAARTPALSSISEPPLAGAARSVWVPVSASSKTWVEKRSASFSTTVSVTRPRPSGVDSQTTRAPLAGHRASARAAARSPPRSSASAPRRSTAASACGGVSGNARAALSRPHRPYTSCTISSIDDFTESRNGPHLLHQPRVLRAALCGERVVAAGAPLRVLPLALDQPAPLELAQQRVHRVRVHRQHAGRHRPDALHQLVAVARPLVDQVQDEQRQDRAPAQLAGERVLRLRGQERRRLRCRPACATASRTASLVRFLPAIPDGHCYV